MVGGFVAALFAGFIGYFKTPRHRVTTTSVAGAIIDNTAIKPLIDNLAELNTLLRAELESRKQQADDDREREKQQNLIRDAMDQFREEFMKNPAEMPSIRRRSLEEN